MTRLWKIWSIFPYLWEEKYYYSFYQIITKANSRRGRDMIVLNEGQTYQEVFFKYLSKKVSFPPSPPPNIVVPPPKHLELNWCMNHNKTGALKKWNLRTKQVQKHEKNIFPRIFDKWQAWFMFILASKTIYFLLGHQKLLVFIHNEWMKFISA